MQVERCGLGLRRGVAAGGECAEAQRGDAGVLRSNSDSGPQDAPRGQQAQRPNKSSKLAHGCLP